MNDDLLSSDDQRLLDRLVDGELGETERRELLLRLDRAPDGWRQCALTFLEAQSWRTEAKAMVAEPAYAATVERRAAAVPQVVPAAQTRKVWDRPSVWVPLATAAGFLLAWTMVRNYDVGGPQGGVIQLAGTGGQAGDKTLASVSLGTPTIVAAADVDPDPSASFVDHPDPLLISPEDLKLVVAGGAARNAGVVRVPKVDALRMSGAALAAVPTMPPEMERMLEQMGHPLARERRRAQVNLSDGLRVVLPLEQVQLRTISTNRTQ